MVGNIDRLSTPQMLADTRSSTRKKGNHLSVALDTNLFNAAILPLRLYTSFTFLRGAISIMARILSRLASIPL